MSNQTNGIMTKTKDELSTAFAQQQLQAETRSFSNAMAKAALQNATAKFEAARAAAQSSSSATVDSAKNNK